MDFLKNITYTSSKINEIPMDNLTLCLQDLYADNYKILPREIKEGQYTWRYTYYVHGSEDSKMFKMSIL